jgi:hypothetical protein
MRQPGPIRIEVRHDEAKGKKQWAEEPTLAQLARAATLLNAKIAVAFTLRVSIVRGNNCA